MGMGMGKDMGDSATRVFVVVPCASQQACVPVNRPDSTKALWAATIFGRNVVVRLVLYGMFLPLTLP